MAQGQICAILATMKRLNIFIASYPYRSGAVQTSVGQPPSRVLGSCAYSTARSPMRSHSNRCHSAMGATCSGKTTVSRACLVIKTRSLLRVPPPRKWFGPTGRNGLDSCTADVKLANEFILDGKAVTLIDTPGFGDTTKSDMEIFKTVAAFLTTK